MRNRHVTLALIVALAANSGAFAKPRADRRDILQSIETLGAKAAVEKLWDTGVWDVMADHIWAGEAEWISLAPKLAPGTDGAAAEGLGIALAAALPKDPVAVLRVIDPHDGYVIGASRVCGVPFLEPSAAFVKRYRARALSAVAVVRDPSLAAVQHACLAALHGH
jgi:hypothetical protein